MRRAVLCALALIALALAPAARASYDPLGGGQARLTLQKGFASFLAADGVKLSATRGARRSGRALTLPVIGGDLDPTIGKGEIDTEGTLTFKAKGAKVPLREITVKTKHSPLIAKVGGGQLKVATAARISSRRQGFGSAFSAVGLKLSAKAATRLNKKLRPAVPFWAGQPLGSLSAEPAPRLVGILAEGRATLAFDPAFLAKLESRFVSLNPVFPAEHLGSTFSFPIVPDGALAPDGSEGTLRTAGALEALQLGGAQLFWAEQWLDLGAHSDSLEADLEPTPSFPGKLGRVGALALSGGAFAADSGARTISLTAAQLALSPDGAGELNQAFAPAQAPAFTAGEAVGSVSFTAQGQ
jgi:hypothetical protein